MRASLTALAAGLLVLSALTVAGCGLKGDLYLPEDEASAPAPDDEETRDDESSAPSGSPAG